MEVKDRIERLVKECSELRKDRIEDQMRRLIQPSAEDSASTLLEMLKDRYESNDWLVVVYGSGAYPYNSSRIIDGYSAQSDSFEAVAYPLKAEFNRSVSERIEGFCSKIRFYFSTLTLSRRCGYPSAPRALWKSEDSKSIYSGLEKILPTDYSFQVLGRKFLPDTEKDLPLAVRSSSTVKDGYFFKYFGYENFTHPWFSSWNDGYYVIAVQP